ncbi:MAG: tRNA (guanine-N(1)-)-methyltransferase [Flavobacteriaceae bacterium]|nr:tRNA (guanosine(37)-N1)-methyltransferase TrmD [Flavobacteriaceae bacterium]CAI8189778.1 MAG: tRNA (guanine-N(1)-)-methyltransferase [Flavobacteriaceae bacterium]
MRIDIITAVPDLLDSLLGHSIVKRAVEKKLFELQIHSLRDEGLGKYRQIDDYPYGGAAGMVLMAEPLDRMLTKLSEQRTYDAIVYLTPDGELWTQNAANQFSLKGNIIMICGHYKGIDQRIRDLWVTHEISIGDFVLSGGEIAAAVLTDSIVRLLPGVLGDMESALSDSFQDSLLAPPVYTRPSEFKGLRVPEVLMSGNFKAIETWNEEEAIKRTKERRPDLLK